MFHLYAEIDELDSYEIPYVLEAVIERYNQLFPDWEIGTFSVERRKDKNEQLDQIIEFFEKLKTL